MSELVLLALLLFSDGGTCDHGSGAGTLTFESETVHFPSDEVTVKRQELGGFVYMNIFLMGKGKDAVSMGVRYRMEDGVPRDVQGDVKIIRGHHGVLVLIGSVVGDTNRVLTIEEDGTITARLDFEGSGQWEDPKVVKHATVELCGPLPTRDSELATNLRRAVLAFPENYPVSRTWADDIPE